MSIPQTSPTSGSGGAPEAPSSADPTTASNVASANAPAEFTAATRIGTMNELRERAPKLYNQMLMGIAQHICSEMRQHAERLKRLIRDGSRKR